MKKTLKERFGEIKEKASDFIQDHPEEVFYVGLIILGGVILYKKGYKKGYEIGTNVEVVAVRDDIHLIDY